MSAGTGALKVSGVPDAIAAERYPWQPLNVGTTRSKPVFRCLENGGSRELGWYGTSDPQPNPKHQKLKTKVNHNNTYLKKLASPKQLTQENTMLWDPKMSGKKALQVLQEPRQATFLERATNASAGVLM